MNNSEITEKDCNAIIENYDDSNSSSITKEADRDRMNVLVSTDSLVWIHNDKIYTKFVLSSIIERYSQILGDLVLCCRVKNVADTPSDLIDITDIVKILIPEKRINALLHKKNIELEKYIDNCDIVIGRLHGFLPLQAERIANKRGKPCFSEVMGCGWDAYWNHGILGKMIAPYMYFNMKRALKKSDFALYVTQRFLQSRYPCPNPSVGVSNVVISDMKQCVLDNRKIKLSNMNSREIILMTCAAVDVWYKGQHYVIKAIPKLNEMGIRVKYYCVGQGDPRYLQKVAKKYGVVDQVVFTGAVPHDRVFELLDECDIYIQPSLQEGLPRALVEAMSRGCPAIGARTGGIPELLPEECITERKAVTDIANKIRLMMDKGLVRYAIENFNRAKDFQEKVLDDRRNAYFEYVKQMTLGERDI